MKSTKFILVCLLLTAFYLQVTSQNNATSKTVTVELNFGTQKSPQTFSIHWVQSMTALEALQYSVPVRTTPAGGYVFVSDIDGVANVTYQKAWYYRVNGKPAKVVAINQPVNIGDTITWIYKEDICSKTAQKNR